MDLDIGANEEIDVENDNNNIANGLKDMANNELQQQDRKLRRTIKKPELFKPISTVRPVHRTAKAKNNAKKKVNTEEEVQYEVDYVFGKRPDKTRKGKMEYRVMWKDFTIEEATWEPEESLRNCPETIEAYERRQSIGGDKEMDSNGEEQPSDDDDAEDNVTIRKKTAKRGKHNETGSTDGKKLKKEKRILPTMRARESKVIREFTVSPVPVSGQPMDTQQHEHSLANLIANFIETSQTDMALATIKQNFDHKFSSFEQRKVYVQLMLLNFLEICAKIYGGNQQDTELWIKALSVGIEATRMAKEGNSSTMPTDLVEQVESTLKLIWLANLDIINDHPLHGKRKELAQRVREVLKEKTPNWEMAAGQSSSSAKENA